MISKLLTSVLVIALFASFPLQAAEKFITVASTTSTHNSGLFDAILPIFTRQTGIGVRVVAVGTGAAVRLARNGDADVLLVHHTPSELKFVADGHGLYRRALMYNDFVLIGPKADPAAVAGSRDIKTGLSRIAQARALFVSRGDDSGTHKRERELWRAAGRAPRLQSGTWYREIGAGMGAALNMAAAQNAYLLSDRSTWLSFSNRQELTILFSGGASLRNVYGIIPLAKSRHPHVKQEMATAFVSWLSSKAGHDAIAAYKIDGEQLFFPLDGQE